MAVNNVETTFDKRFSSENATATPWATGREALENAEVYWLTTVRPDGRPHVTPLIAIWQDEAMHFCTGPDEQKAKNIIQNAHCIMTTGCNRLGEGLDLVVEGDATLVSDESRLRRLADAYQAKYGWHFDVRDGSFFNDADGRALVYAIVPQNVFAFGKGEPYSQTRWRF